MSKSTFLFAFQIHLAVTMQLSIMHFEIIPKAWFSHLGFSLKTLVGASVFSRAGKLFIVFHVISLSPFRIILFSRRPLLIQFMSSRHCLPCSIFSISYTYTICKRTLLNHYYVRGCVTHLSRTPFSKASSGLSWAESNFGKVHTRTNNPI